MQKYELFTIYDLQFTIYFQIGEFSYLEYEICTICIFGVYIMCNGFFVFFGIKIVVKDKKWRQFEKKAKKSFAIRLKVRTFAPANERNDSFYAFLLIGLARSSIG